MSKTNNFYTLLPSNSCPRIHPDNNASRFIVAFENPIYLNEQWEVALMDFTFIYSAFQLYNKSYIKYVTGEDYERNVEIIINNKEKSLMVHDVGFEVIDERSLSIILKHHDYVVIFDNLEDAKRFGFNTLRNNIESDSILQYQDFKNDDSIDVVKMKLVFSIETNKFISL